MGHSLSWVRLISLSGSDLFRIFRKNLSNYCINGLKYFKIFSNKKSSALQIRTGRSGTKNSNKIFIIKASNEKVREKIQNLKSVF